MTETALEHTLRNLASVGKLVKDRGYRQVWRFEHDGRAYFLKFYPRHGTRDAFRRLTRGSPALLEFERLQWLQKADIPAPRVVAVLYGLQITGQKGDAVILHALEPSVQLDHYLNGFELRGCRAPRHRELAAQVRSLVKQLAKAGLSHEDLHLGNFLLKGDQVYLLDAYAVQQGGLRLKDLMLLGHSVRRFASTTDLLRGWNELGPGGRMPRANPVSRRLWRDFLKRVTVENRYFGKLSAENWAGTFFKHDKYPRRWSDASRLEIHQSDWVEAWPRLLADIEADRLPVIKRSPSGEVLRATVRLAGKDVDVIIKRPRRRYWYRYINEIGRGSRAYRGWIKAWKMVLRDLPTAWPLLLMEKRELRYATDGLVVFECVPGPTLARLDLDSVPHERREMIFRRVGRILRTIERLGFAHFDAKASNWIVRDDQTLGPSPVMIDVDGIRQRRWTLLGIRRLLRSLKAHRQYSPEDSLALCRGYAPYAALAVAPPPEQVAGSAADGANA